MGKAFLFVIVVAVVIAMVSSLAGISPPWPAAVAGIAGGFIAQGMIAADKRRTREGEEAPSDPIARELDRLAEATGVPGLNRRMENFKARNFRVIPLLLILAAFAGLIMQARGSAFGYATIAFAWAASLVIFNFSPVQRSAFRRRLPEHELAVRSAQRIGLGAALAVAVLGCLFLGLGPVFEELHWSTPWAPRQGLDWMSIALLLLTVQLDASIVAASWTSRSSDEL